MNPEAVRPKRIRFRRGEIVDLDALPSARGGGPPGRDGAKDFLHKRLRGRRILRGLAALAATGLCFVVLLAAGLYAAAVSGFGKEQLRAAAERAIERAAGRDMTTEIGETRISLDGTHLIGLEIADVGLATAGQPGALLKAGRIRFGVRLLPLLSGRLALSGATVSDATIRMEALAPSSGKDWLAPLRDSRGLLDPGKLPPAVFARLHDAFAAVTQEFAGTLSLADIRVILLDGQAVDAVRIERAEASADGAGTLSVEAVGGLGAGTWSLSGVAEQEAETGRIAHLALHVGGTGPSNADAGHSLGEFEIELTGEERTGEAPSHLGLEARVDKARAELGRAGSLAGAASVSLAAREGAPVVEVAKLRLTAERSSFEVGGTFGPAPAGMPPVYRFDLGGDGLTVSAVDSPEPPFVFQARSTGSFDPAGKRFSMDEIELDAGPGAVHGAALLQLAAGRTPGLDLALDVSRLPVSGAKQLWPWFAGRGARKWADAHLFDGTVDEGRLNFNVAPGRLGDGVPASAEELSGSFSMSGVRFDTAGAMPQMREASGSITFQGVDADIALAAGRMDLPSGRQLAAADGMLALRAVNRPPLIGKLTLAAAGETAALAELASLDPINAGPRLPIGADDLSGTAKVRIAADIPLQRGVPRERLAWNAAIEFEELAIAKPLEGQLLSDAAGTLAIDPQKAVIAATGKLNGAPATLDLVEPLGGSGQERLRRVEVTLDDKARNALAPGLDALLSGPVSIVLDASDESREMAIDLTKARLDVPWIGWSKGTGIDARASFSLAREGDVAILSDLSIKGASFSVSGSASVAKGGLQAARLDHVRLNQNDDFALDVRRSGTGYQVNVKGRSLDGRSLIRAATASGAPKGQKAAQASVSLTADLQSVAGFGGESLRNVSLRYRTGKGQGRSVALRAATDTGATVVMEDGVKEGKRLLDLESDDAGSVLRFLDIYPRMEGGKIDVGLVSTDGKVLKGKLSALNFSLVDEPRLASLVTTRAQGSDRSLQEAVRRGIDTARVKFDRASADIEKGESYLAIQNGVLRGVAIGSTFQGTVYDRRGQMNMTGTFMPAYGLNRLFGELPLIGVILGNGEDRGLIGVTFKLQGAAKSPKVTVNPLSLIAPGIFRNIFEFDGSADAAPRRPTTAVQAR